MKNKIILGSANYPALDLPRSHGGLIRVDERDAVKFPRRIKNFHQFAAPILMGLRRAKE